MIPKLLAQVVLPLRMEQVSNLALALTSDWFTHSEQVPNNKHRQPAIRSAVLFLVRAIGLEPTHLKILDPKSSASTNSATPACKARSNQERAAKLVLLAVKTKHHLISIKLSILSIIAGFLSSRIRATAGNRSLNEGWFSTLVVRFSSGSSAPPPDNNCNIDTLLATG